MNFTCPHCGLLQVVTAANSSKCQNLLQIGVFAQLGDRESSHLFVANTATRCANEDCRNIEVTTRLSIGYFNTSGINEWGNSSFRKVQVYPSTWGKPFPAAVPAAMLEDYNEAWAVVNLSPKSAATLARRCLQAMIRDFCDIHERTLFHEIQKLEQRLTADDLPRGVEAETIEAMKALKDVGNIGAHMSEVDGVIVEVEPGEAEALLGLIEMLFSDWYVARDKRKKRLEEIQAIALAKKQPPAQVVTS